MAGARSCPSARLENILAVQPLIFRKGLDMKEAVAGELAAAYDSALVDDVRANEYRFESGRLTIHLAREFGFCYGVDRAVDYAYQARRRFPGRNVFLTGEIIHNPHVNDRLRGQGIRFLSDPGEHRDALGSEDVVILPAFGVTVAEMKQLTEQGCTLVDTTCGSVLNVWKNVIRYAQDGFTSIIHGKVKHEETRATASQALKYANGCYLVVLDRAEAAVVCDYIRHGGDREAFLDRFGPAASPGFDPDRDLVRIGCANQTTMLMSESLAIGEMFRGAMADRYGEASLASHFRAFDTICSATQERQDAVIALLESHALDLMLVVGGYNSSNTCNLARICAERVRTYHIADPECLASADEILHRPVGAPSTIASREERTRHWLPGAGPVNVGLTAGASTPNNIVGQVIKKLEAFARGSDGTRTQERER
jgi:4-hydroxy-3-methylbut-2-enyl diphosphate reductase